MGRWLLPGLIFMIFLVGAVLWKMPLAYALNKTDLQSRGVQWQNTGGTVWNGQIRGIVVARQSLGAANLRLWPGDLLKGRISYDVELRGTPGRGSGRVSAGRNEFSVIDLRAEIDLSVIEGLSENFRRMGGKVRANVDEIVFRDKLCTQASGKISTEFLSQAAMKYGRSWPELTGEIRCDQGMLLAPLKAQSEAGETVTVDIRVGMAAPTSLEARVTGASAELETVIGLMGFWMENGDLVYKRDITSSGRQP